MRGGPTGEVPGRDAFDIVALAGRKAELGLTTSVVIPAREEGPRVGAVVAAMRRAMEPVGTTGTALVDELIVIDGMSRDDTAAAAERAGARVVAHGPTGKGAALRRGVEMTSGDLIAFVDADVLDPDPWLAVGTLAPLLLDEDVRLVKSAAQRSWRGGMDPATSASTATGGGAGPTATDSGGGRVTELTVRPLLALLWPELAHIAQPLAGEYAADRALLESLPFETGYGVELGLLLDTSRLHGPGSIAQVDLGVRGHEHQALDALGRMAGELLLVMLDRLALEGRALPGPIATDALLLPRPVRDADGVLRSERTVVRRTALAPLVSGGPLRRRRGPSPTS
jgi:glucosyl-3-phosphoglycerate synthase